ncbi:tryptophan--tRNA ligase [Buchnera aphidicola (Thelaxes californica)]|uniref:Tryptophan--tRNA ligase n=1 Tax=Buchnera aphidicola (Thelaxes californica) TaxID=1315998 RepID=A0A4D6YA93_9GAMM|nr:tryptophan--tRNA ligase [Buchnera aphidicola]QCI26936.1 tryptophan--tRNA ligase [Buchnera aphidicola (Thelaxes californica)]
MCYKKNIVFSAVQPSGQLTLANYIGTMRYWESMQQKNQCIYCIADLHSITGFKHSSFSIIENVLNTIALYLAVGVDPNQSIIFVQSHVYEHCQFYWLLNCHTYYGELLRMTQFKQKYQSSCNNQINTGLLNYPILMASDILLYQSNIVLIGNDQKQHLELAQKIAKRINFFYSTDVVTSPKPYIPEYGSKIMSLSNPIIKMSKSDSNKDSTIFLFDSYKDIIRKVNKAITDSENPPRIYYDIEKKPGISNLLEIFSSINDISINSLINYFYGKTYQDFKHCVSESIFQKLCVLQKKYWKWRQDEKFLIKIAQIGAKKAQHIANTTLTKMYKILTLCK